MSSVVPEPPGAGNVSADAADLRRFFRRHAAGVGLITASLDGQPVGLLVTSLASVSTDPPLLVFNVSRASSSWPALAVADYIGVHVVAAEQEQLAELFTRKGADRFAPPTVWHRGQAGVPVIDGVAAAAVARVEERVTVSDHVIVIARLLAADVREGAASLLHHDGAYHRGPHRLRVVRPS